MNIFDDGKNTAQNHRYKNTNYRPKNYFINYVVIYFFHFIMFYVVINYDVNIHNNVNNPNKNKHFF